MLKVKTKWDKVRSDEWKKKQEAWDIQRKILRERDRERRR